jgi:hypothetical protein
MASAVAARAAPFGRTSAKYGVVFMTSRSSAGDDVIVGLVPDDVIAVHLDGRSAVMGENVFIADDGSTGRTLTFTTRTGQRQMPLGRPDEGGETEAG